MKLKHSLFTRRQFLNGLLGGWLGAFLGSLLYPVVKFVFPPYREPDKVVLPLSDYADIVPNAVKFLTRLFALPVYQDISRNQIEFMVQTLSSMA